MCAYAHEGIVTQEEFDTVQQLMMSRRREKNKGGFENIFSGVIKCADCGYALRAMSANRRKRPDIIDCVQYTCNNYGRYGNVMCTAHAIEARDLFNAVLADINRFADMAVNDERAVRAIEKRLTETDQSKAKAMEKEQKKLNKRLAELDRLFSSLYEDKVMERITERNFEMMSGKYQKEQLEIEARLKEVTETLNESYEKSQGIRDFLSLIRNYQGLKELDATVVNALIDKILVSEREKSADGTVKQEIKIYYKFIGFVGELHITPTKRWTALPAKHCTVCGIEYVPGSAISKYCPACAKKIQRERGIEGKRRSRERKRQVCIELSAKNDRLNEPREKGDESASAEDDYYFTEASEEQMANTHQIGEKFKIHSFLDADMTDIELEATVTDIQTADDLSLLTKEEAIPDYMAELIGPDGKLISDTLYYMKDGDGVSTMPELVRTEETSLKLVYATVEFSNPGTEAVHNAWFMVPLIPIVKEGNTYKIFNRADDTCDYVENEHIGVRYEMLYHDISGGQKHNNYIPEIKPGESVTMHLAWIVNEDELDKLYLDFRGDGIFSEEGLKTGYVPNSPAAFTLTRLVFP